MELSCQITKINGGTPWQCCDWSTYYDPKRITENRALRSLKTQTTLLRRIGGRDTFNKLEEQAFLLERLYLTLNYPLNTINHKISERLSIPLILVERVLQTCMLIMYYRELMGLSPLDY